MLLVEIEKPENEPLGMWFADLRSWLDNHHYAPSRFVQVGRRVDRLIYQISFEIAAQAHEFCAAFVRYRPAIRRANSFERDQLKELSTGQTPPGSPAADHDAAAGALLDT